MRGVGRFRYQPVLPRFLDLRAWVDYYEDGDPFVIEK